MALQRPGQFPDPRPQIGLVDLREQEPDPPGTPVPLVIDKPPAAQQSIDANTLVAHFLGSNCGSRMAYGGKILDVSGQVADTRRDTATGVIVLLEGRNPYGKVVRCTEPTRWVVKSVKLGDVMAEVVSQLGKFEIVSAITRGSAEGMNLHVGDRGKAVI